MKFSQMPYTRPEFETVNAKLTQLLQRFKAAQSVAECLAIHKEYSDYSAHIGTLFSIASTRKDINTADPYYAAEAAYMDETRPKLQAVHKEMTAAVLESPFRKALEARWSPMYFKNAEMTQKTFNPAVIAEMQENNKIVTEYQRLTASAQIDFDGKTLNLAQLAPYAQSTDRQLRKAAVMARASWYAAHAAELDSLADRVIQVRARMAEKLGFKDFAQMGQARMKRHFGGDMLQQFRDGVAAHVVPAAARLKAEQARRIGLDRLELYDDGFMYPDGNPDPIGTAEDIFAHGKKMYHELSGETAEFIDFMLENELFDVAARAGKAPGGYCAMFNEYGAPFIFATFTGTAGDISVLTHEAGHALAFYAARDIYPPELQSTFGETAEVHSMSMEFFTWPWMEGFFGDQTEKFRQSHITKAITALPFGTMLDEFEHMIYAKPQMSPQERNALWLSLEKKYRPWLDCADIPFYGEGRAWQAILHIFTVPLYYISYCLAQTVALCFWAEDQRDHEGAWKKYLHFLGLAQTKSFEALIAEAGLPSPFQGETLRQLCQLAREWLDKRPQP